MTIDINSVRAGELITIALHSLGLPVFGENIVKTGSGYGGPGTVCGLALAEDGSPRVVVSHRIEGGTGALMHIYTPGLIRATAEGEHNDMPGAD